MASLDFLYQEEKSTDPGLITIIAISASGVLACLALGISLAHSRAMTRELRELRRYGEELLEALPEALAVFSAEGRLLEHNSTFRRLFGLPAQATALPISPSALTAEDSGQGGAGLAETIRLAASGSSARAGSPAETDSPADLRSPFITHWLARSLDGRREFPVSAELYPLARDGETTVLALIREREPDTPHVETPVRDQEELHRSARMEAAFQVAGAVAENFNDILTGIMGNLSLLKIMCENNTRLDKGQVAERLRAAMDACLQAGEVTRALKDLAVVDRPAEELFDLRILLDDAVRICHHSFDQVCGLEYDAPRRAFMVRGDRDAIERALLNVCVNAYQAMEEGRAAHGEEPRGAIKLSLSAVNPDPRLPGLFPHIEPDLEYARIEVRDSGAGMDPATLRRVFDPFFSARDGLGLGMSVVYAIMKAHQGSVDMESVPGQGSCVRLHLPLARRPEEVAQDESIPSTTMYPLSGIPAPRAEPGILAVIADAASRIAIQGLLGACGYSVQFPDSTIAAVSAWNAGGFRAAILDLSASGPSGIEAYEAIAGADPDACILLLYSMGDRDSLAASLGILPSRLLRKPLSLRKLREALEDLGLPIEGCENRNP